MNAGQAVSGVNAISELHDIRGPVSIPGEWLWLWTFLALLVVVATGMLLSRWWRRRKSVPAVLSRPAWEVALEKLAAIERGGYVSKGFVKEYYSEISAVVRWYIEERFAVRSPEMTTEEFMEAVRHSDKMTAAQQKFLIEFLNASDMVKFAKFIPLPQQMHEAIRLARTFVEEAR